MTMSKARLRMRAVLTSARSAPAPALILLAFAGWALMAWSGSAAHGSHAIGPADPLVSPGHSGHGSTIAVAAMLPGLGMWLAMILAMSPLLLVRELGHLRRTSLRRNRTANSVLFLFGYALVWALAGLIVVPLASAIAGSAALVCLTVIAVLVWQFCPPRRRLLRRCHRLPALRAFGADAYRESLRYGLGSGAICVGICGPIMVLVLLTAQFHLVAMAVAAILLTIERYLPARRRDAPLPIRGWRFGAGSGSSFALAEETG